MRRREKKNKRKVTIIVISIVCLLILVTVGYAVFSTILSLTAKGNVVDNSVDITDNVVTEGDGLYKDEYEENRYIYRGIDPDNYIWFNDEMWRIISVENDGTIKIMRRDPLEAQAWDTDGDTFGSNNWARPADLNTYLNEEYLLTLSDTDKVVSYNFNIGAVTAGNNDLAGQITEEEATKWNGKVGLMTVSEYIRANTNTTQCGTLGLININYDICATTNWMYEGFSVWTINQVDSASVYLLNQKGNLQEELPSSTSVQLYPVLYLNSNIILTGSGTEDEPYQIN